MSKHTPEPWKINHDDSTEEWSIVTNQHGSIVANVNEETGPELAGSIPVMRKMPGMENARRIVACVNACAGVSNGELAMTTMSVVLARINEAEQQRDELLAALEEAKSVLSSINTGRQHKVEVEDDEPAFWQRNEWVTWAKGEILPMIEAAIAKAKGGAA